ncbi:MAG: hypothetical protein HY674_06105 [Chloroflexi bacterium]|nr:hypothetical protein [Chloroflexota bacterium]
MDATTLRQHLVRLDSALGESARLCIYGSAALMLMGEEGRVSVDVDVAGPYSTVNEAALAEAARAARLPVNPPEDFAEDHLEWVGPARLCLAAPRPDESVVLWQGRWLTVFTLPPSDLAASRLIRYDPIDQADIQFLIVHGRVRYEDIAQAVHRLPVAFRDDVLVRENLENLRRDMQRWIL